MEAGLQCEIKDGHKEEDELKKEGNHKERMTNNGNKSEKENYPKHFTGRGGLIIFFFSYKYFITEF